MNIFEIIPTYLFVEDEEDLKFVNNYLKNNNLNQTVKIGDVICTKKQNTYIVKPLDTIKTISQKLGISEEDLKQKINGKSLYIGQKLLI